MKIITWPDVYLVGQQVRELDLANFLDDNDVDDWSTDAKSSGEALCEVAGRLCYMSFKNPRPGGNRAYLAHIKELRHGSVIEHCVMSFIFTGISRSLTHELVRHRAGWSYSQLSQRFVDEKDTAFVLPPAIIPDSPEYQRWVKNCQESLDAYIELSKTAASVKGTSEKKRIREMARSVLPNCTETKIFCTVNARALRHFLELRGSSGADAEIRRLALVIHKKVVIEYPELFGDYSVNVDADNNAVLETPYPKV